MARMTVQQIDALKARDKPYKKAVDTGLQVRVATNGVKMLVVQYMIDGRQREYRLPRAWGPATDLGHISLADARGEAAAIRALARRGIDYQVQQEQEREAERQRALAEQAAVAARLAQEQRENLTVHALFDAWCADGVRRKDGNAELRRSFGKDVLRTIGAIPVRLLTEHDLRAMFRMLVERGVNRLAVVTYNNLRQMLRWAEKRQPWRKLLAEGNPIDLVEIDKVVSADYDLGNVRQRVLSAAEIGELHRVLAQMDVNYEQADDRRRAVRPLAPTTKAAIWIMLSTLCRVGELTKARWEHVNLETGEWFIPKENSKGQRHKKIDFMIFLSPFALEQFRRLHPLTGHTAWCFPAVNRGGPLCEKTFSKQIGDRQAALRVGPANGRRKRLSHRSRDSNALILAGGVQGAWTAHDLRRTGATLMQELRVPLEVIDRCQNHVLPGSKVRRHYMLHDYADEKRRAWNLLGERLMLLTTSYNVVQLNHSA